MTQLSQSSLAFTGTIPTVGVGRLWDTGCQWAQVNTAAATFTDTPCDATITFYINAGARPAFVFGKTPVWATTGGVGTGADPPSDIGSGNAILIAMVNHMVTHLASTHPGIHWIMECVNEADLGSEWTGTMAQLVTYCTALRTAAHAADPQILVLGPSGSGLNTSNVKLYSDGNNYAGTAGAAASMDAINIHAYLQSCSVFCTVPETLQTSLAAQVFGTGSQLTAVGQPLAGKPVYFSEGSEGGGGNINTMTAAQQRQYVEREYMYMLMYGVQGYWRYAFDSHPDNLSLSFGGMCFGAIPASCTPQNSATAFHTLQTWLVGASYAFPASSARNQDGSGTWTFQLTSSPASTGPALLIVNASSTPSVSVSSVYTKILKWDGTNSAIVANAVTAGPDVVMAVP